MRHHHLRGNSSHGDCRMLVAYFTYRAIREVRHCFAARVFAAGVAGYLAINVPRS